MISVAPAAPSQATAAEEQRCATADRRSRRGRLLPPRWPSGSPRRPVMPRSGPASRKRSTESDSPMAPTLPDPPPARQSSRGSTASADRLHHPVPADRTTPWQRNIRPLSGLRLIRKGWSYADLAAGLTYGLHPALIAIARSLPGVPQPDSDLNPGALQHAGQHPRRARYVPACQPQASVRDLRPWPSPPPAGHHGLLRALGRFGPRSPARTGDARR